MNNRQVIARFLRAYGASGVGKFRTVSPGRPVLLAHMSVTGANISRGRFTLTEQYDVIADANDLPSGWDYVALGHIHKPQCVGGLAQVRYAGSLDRLDFTERGGTQGNRAG